MFSLAPYRLLIETNGNQVDLWHPNGEDGFAKWFFEYLEKELGALQHRKDKRISRVSRLCANQDKSFVCGQFQTGDYGYTSQLIDSVLSQVSHERTKEEAELIPFFFSLTVPKQAKWGVLILQKFKNLGIHDFFVPKLQFEFEKAFKGKRLIIERLVPSTLINTLLDNSEIKTIRFVHAIAPTSVEDALLESGYKTYVDEAEIVLRARRNTSFPMIAGIKEIVSGKKNFADVFAIQNWNYDSIKLELDYAGKRRTVDLGSPFKINPNIDITDDVSEGPDGHPLWGQILPYAGEFSLELFQSLDPTASIDLTIEIDKEAEQLGDLVE